MLPYDRLIPLADRRIAEKSVPLTNQPTFGHSYVLIAAADGLSEIEASAMVTPTIILQLSII